MNQKINDAVNEQFQKIYQQLDTGELDNRLNYLQWEDKIINILRELVSTQGSEDLTDKDIRKEMLEIGIEKGLKFIPDLLQLELFEDVDQILQKSEYVNRELNGLVLKTKQERNELNKVRFELPEDDK